MQQLSFLIQAPLFNIPYLYLLSCSLDFAIYVGFDKILP
jgi:hypothetical protein